LTLQQARLYVACLFLLGYAGAAPRQSRDSKSAQPPPRFRFGFHWHDQASVSAAAASPSKIFDVLPIGSKDKRRTLRMSLSLIACFPDRRPLFLNADRRSLDPNR
jgi:hypothetical protein